MEGIIAITNILVKLMKGTECLYRCKVLHTKHPVIAVQREVDYTRL